jgi:hypothetical protein
LALKIQKGYHRTKARKLDIFKEDLKQDTPLGSRRKLKHKAMLDDTEKLEIAHKVIIGMEKHSEVASEYQVSNARVS